MIGDIRTYAAAVGHRGFSAGSNLLITIMAGRQLDAQEFGLFALMIGFVALILILHVSVFSEPMMVYGPKKYLAALRPYLVLLGSTQLAFGVGVGALALMVGAAIDGGEAYLVLALIFPLAFSMDAQERSFIMQMRPVITLAGGALQFAALCFLLFGLHRLDLSELSDFLLVHAIGLSVVNIFLLCQHVLRWRDFGNFRLDIRDVVYHHMRFSVWSLTSHLLLFTCTNLYVFVLPLLHDLGAAANFRSHYALIGAGVQAFSAIGMLAIPMLSAAHNQESFLKSLRKIFLIITVVGLIILLGVGALGGWLINAIYDGKYALSTAGYWIAGVYPMVMGYVFLMGSALRALDRSDQVARAASVAVVLGLPPGLWLSWAYETEGAILAQLIGATIMSVYAAFILRQIVKT